MAATADPVISWLLGEDNPSVRYLALKWLLGASDSDRKVVTARKAIMKTGFVPALLALQNADGSWGEAKDFYRHKYGGTSWQLIILAEHRADPADQRIRNACEFILSVSQEREGGGFSVDRSIEGSGGLPSLVIPCLTGNMVYSLVSLGMGADPRVRAGVDWICRWQRFDDGESEGPSGGPYDRYEMCWGRHSCHMGVVKALKALAAIPPETRGKREKATIKKAVEYLLLHRIHMKSHEPGKVARPGWLKPGFPLMYQSDILEILDMLVTLGIRDGRMEPALDALRALRCKDGTWKLKSTMNGKLALDVEAKGKPSKWITLRALRVLAAFDA